MKLYYSARTGGFYTTDLHAELFVEHVDVDPGTGEVTARYLVPDPAGPIADAVMITDDEHTDLLQQQAQGCSIQPDAQGRPVAVAPAPLTLEEIKAGLCLQVDSAAEAAYGAIGSDSPGRLAEYQQAKSDALAFQAAGYVGNAPATVACWAQAQNWTAQQACEDILATASAWEQALVAIRTARLLGKANVTAAADADTAHLGANTAMANIAAVPVGL